MIFTINLRKFKPSNYDESYAIVRSYSRHVRGLDWLSCLAPSKELYHKYLMWRDLPEWGEEMFNREYVPQFVREFERNTVGKWKLEQLAKSSQVLGRNIALACYCPNEVICHRAIIAAMLQRDGYDVITETGIKYNEYLTYFSN